MTVVGLALYFRKRLDKLFERVTEFTGFGVSLKVRDNLEAADDEINESLAGQNISQEGDSKTPKDADLLQMADKFGRAAIIESFRRLEIQARRTLRVTGSDRNYSSKNIYFSIWKDLTKSGLLSEEELKAFNRLRRVRNDATHKQTHIAAGEASQYVLLAIQLRDKLANLAEESPILE